jgi:hypothetical protein
MTTKELLYSQFKTYVFWARVLKNYKISSWAIYVFQAQKTLNLIKLIESKEEVTKTHIGYGKIIVMDKYKKVA